MHPHAAASPPVTIIIVAYNAGAFIQPCLDAVAVQTCADFEVVVVDNASSDGSIASLALPDDRFRIHDAGENLGFAAANNLVARDVSTPYIVTLNADTRVATDWLEELLAAVERWPEAVAFGSTQLRLDEVDVLDGAGDVWHAAGVAWRALEGRPLSENPPEGETFAPCAAAALYRRDMFLSLGGFDENFFCYCEDVDLGFRIRLAGHICVQVRDAVVYHAGSGTTGRHSDFTVFHGHRNRVWVFVKNTPGPLLWLLLPMHIALNLRILQKSPTAEYAATVKRAYAAAWAGRKQVWASRKAVRAGRRVGLMQILRAMAWTPRLITRRAALLNHDGTRVGTHRN
ncbi:glycosyltransferase family 2 protein [uncultured Maricaulis sp.]|uniref:glycosyltransferase family 2 protein n=1 Tax=uncultured Maricaulis sp. TaxID=174710 RepID=UPI0030DCA84B|tara:strand:+ start:10491 stop:11519 length:1029 start_codon:yes stop_codon:yes gene_type:complete